MYWDAPLYTAVPSRSFFPRGFLWDEGFHNLLISKWSPEISADILGHWMDLLNSEGWIPREQILGLEARAKVPDEFVVQHNKNANPPTLLLTLHSLVRDVGDAAPTSFREYLMRMWPRLEKWYDWFNTTQMGKVPGTFRYAEHINECVKATVISLVEFLLLKLFIFQPPLVLSVLTIDEKFATTRYMSDIV